MRPTYSPMIPKQISCTPPINNCQIIARDHPLTSPSTPKILSSKTTMISQIASPDAANPVHVATRSGRIENETMPSSANRVIFQKENFVEPAARAERQYETPV